MNERNQYLKLALIALFFLFTPHGFYGFSSEVDDLIERLGSDDYQLREQAIKDLEIKKPSNLMLEKWIESSSDPEVKARLEYLWLKSNRLISFDVGSDLPGNVFKQGYESNGSELLLVRVKYKGEIYLGKYSKKFSVAYIPVADKEVEAKSGLAVLTGKGTWLSVNQSKKPWVAGKNKAGKKVYAIRAEIHGGMHMGMLVEGHKKGRISYGGKVVEVEQYEVLQE